MQLGFSRLMNLAIASFYGLGAYTYAIISTKLGMSFLPTLCIAISLNALISLIISQASKRFKEEIFVLVSLAFQMIIFSILWNWDSLTGGANGIINISEPSLFGFEVNNQIKFSILGGIFLILVIAFSSFLHNSPFGRTLKAIRDNEVASLSLGKNTTIFKSINIAISSGIASISGVLFASYIGYIDPTSFDLNESIDILFILILGGLLNVRGAILGTVVFFLLQELFKLVGFNDSISFNLRIILFSVAVVTILYLKPNGLFGKYTIEE